MAADDPRLREWGAFGALVVGGFCEAGDGNLYEQRRGRGRERRPRRLPQDPPWTASA